MALKTVFIAFERDGSEAKELNVALGKVRERMASEMVRIINVETVPPTTFLGFQVQAGGLRVWYDTAVDHVQAGSGKQPEGDAKAFHASVKSTRETIAELKQAAQLEELVTEASSVAELLWSRVNRQGQPGIPAGETLDAMRSAACVIDQLLGQVKVVDLANRREALILLVDGLCRIREAAFDAPAHAVDVANVLHNVPGLLSGEDRAGEGYLVELLRKGRSLIDDISWRKSAQ
ncbi:hypothetical protein AX279_17635 [Pseudomonas sp. J237]|nr:MULTISPECIES: hypothetical protein [Pseudomonas]OEO24490.1 hypothetical protein AX279_17635 [Pseudomonas sp. J237]CRN68519.1 hypothetical protein PAERUG_P40_Scotland_4_VIM_2_09_12_04157 [Pseudomonas aeruginosa]